MPQLSGGEFGWAVDTQQLYIGNGSVSEGAPFVGNTEILTQNSNIFELLGAYTYRGHSGSTILTGADVNNPVRRTLQSKLDDVINVRDFGVDDLNPTSSQTTTERTLALQRALNQLFLNSDAGTARSKRVLFIPAGEYAINDVLRIPSYATIMGEGAGKTIIIQTDQTKSVFQTVGTDSTLSAYQYLATMTGTTYPRNVNVESLTLKRGGTPVTATPVLMLDCLVSSQFNDCELIGGWSNNTGEDTDGYNSLVHIRSLGATSSYDLQFNNCSFSKAVHAVYCDYTANNISFDKCNFNELFRGLTLAKGSDGTPGKDIAPSYFEVTNSRFDSVDAEAWKVFSTVQGGTGHTSKGNQYFDVGNYNQGYGSPVYPVLDFRVSNCESVNDYFERSLKINEIGNATKAYLPDVLGPQTVTYTTRTATLNYNTSTAKTLFKLPLWTGLKVTVDYVIKKNYTSVYRSGTLTINAHPDMAVLGSTVQPLVKDEFIFSSSDALLTSPNVGGNINFSAITSQLAARPEATLVNPTLPITAPSDIARPTLIVKFTNPTGPGGDANIEYSITVTAGYKQI